MEVVKKEGNSVKLAKVIECEQQLALLTQINIKGKKSFDIAKQLKKAAEELDVFKKIKDEKIKFYGKEIETPQGPGHSIEPDSENFPIFLKEMEEIVDQDSETNFPILEDADIDWGVTSIKPAHIMPLLGWIIK